MGQTLRDLFKSRKGEVYGSTGNQIFIETQGVINIPRQAALLASSPSGLNQLIGNQIGGLFKGSANRPSDTIYPSNKGFEKPVSLIPGGITGVQDAVEGGDKRYFINKKPSGNSLVGQLRSGKKPTALLGGAAVNALKNPFRAAKGIADMIKGLQEKEESAAEYGAKYNEVQSPGEKDTRIIDDANFTDIKYTTHYREYTREDATRPWQRGDLKRRKRRFQNGKRPFSDIVYRMQSNATNVERSNPINVPYVRIDPYESDINKSFKPFLFPATITGLTENFSPEVSAFRYVGSPFNLYTYKGVERSIQFSFKLYFVDHKTKTEMIKTLNRLRTLVFPSPDVASITYPSNAIKAPILAIKPNIIRLTISGVYEQVLGIVDSFGISIEDSVPWVTTIPDNEINTKSMDGEVNGGQKPYPSVISCTFGMKIIENPDINLTTKEEDFQLETTKNGQTTKETTKVTTVTSGQFKYGDVDNSSYFTGVKNTE